MGAPLECDACGASIAQAGVSIPEGRFCHPCWRAGRWALANVQQAFAWPPTKAVS